jgi:cytochrome c oxidase subunit 2
MVGEEGAMPDPVVVDSSVVLWGQTLVYTAYALAVLSVVGWFGLKVTSAGTSTSVSPRFFWAWVALLVVIGVTLHLFTYNTIPWVQPDLHREGVAVDRSFELTVADHEFSLPEEQLAIGCGETVRFNVLSSDLTYGFGLFRPDNSMLLQMQVVPGHDNELLWTFTKNGSYAIRSTEYSGPAGHQMIIPDAVVVSGCAAS